MLAHDRIEIDGISYLLEGEVESLSLGDTNLYQIKANLVRSNEVFENSERASLTESLILPTGSPLQLDETASGLLTVD